MLWNLWWTVSSKGLRFSLPLSALVNGDKLFGNLRESQHCSTRVHVFWERKFFLARQNCYMEPTSQTDFLPFFFFLKGVYNVNLNSRLDKQLLITACSQRKRRLIPLRPQKGYLPCPALVLPHVSLLLFCQNCFNEDFAKQASFLPFSFDSLKEKRKTKPKNPRNKKQTNKKPAPDPGSWAVTYVKWLFHDCYV